MPRPSAPPPPGRYNSGNVASAPSAPSSAPPLPPTLATIASQGTAPPHMEQATFLEGADAVADSFAYLTTDASLRLKAMADLPDREEAHLGEVAEQEESQRLRRNEVLLSTESEGHAYNR